MITFPARPTEIPVTPPVQLFPSIRLSDPMTRIPVGLLVGPVARHMFPLTTHPYMTEIRYCGVPITVLFETTAWSLAWIPWDDEPDTVHPVTDPFKTMMPSGLLAALHPVTTTVPHEIPSLVLSF